MELTICTGPHCAPILIHLRPPKYARYYTLALATYVCNGRLRRRDNEVSLGVLKFFATCETNRQ